jgi:hypothetical protein
MSAALYEIRKLLDEGAEAQRLLRFAVEVEP